MSDQPENNQILTQQPETIASLDTDSEPAETPTEIAPAEDTLTATSERPETPTEIPPATIDYQNYSTQLNRLVGARSHLRPET